ncbi:MAG: hypothetical protein WA996_03370 [Candidatus Promineifilaceae bacterium]
MSKTTPAPITPAAKANTQVEPESFPSKELKDTLVGGTASTNTSAVSVTIGPPATLPTKEIALVKLALTFSIDAICGLRFASE